MRSAAVIPLAAAVLPAAFAHPGKIFQRGWGDHGNDDSVEGGWGGYGGWGQGGWGQGGSDAQPSGGAFSLILYLTLVTLPLQINILKPRY